MMSAIYKEPVDGPVRVEGVNLAGDDQADRRVHGGPDKAVYAYAREDADWWAEQLGLRVIRQGRRRWYDRADRRDLSVLRLGRTAMQTHLEAGHAPPLPFHRRGQLWRYAWLA